MPPLNMHSTGDRPSSVACPPPPVVPGEHRCSRPSLTPFDLCANCVPFEPSLAVLDSSMLLALKDFSIRHDEAKPTDSSSCCTLQSYGSSSSSSPSNSHTPPPPSACFPSAHSADSVLAPAECEYDSAEDSPDGDPLLQWIDNQLTVSLFGAYQRLKQPPYMHEHKLLLQRSITDALAGAFGPSRLFKLFTTGSCATGLATLSSDIDLCLIFLHPRTGQMDARYDCKYAAIAVLEEIAGVLVAHELAFQPKVIQSNPPILKFTDELNCEVNLNINKFVTIQNTLLLQRICALDSRIRPFLLTVKLWALRNGINCAYLKSFSSYALSLLGVFVLQHVCHLVPRNLEQLIGEVNEEADLLIYGHPHKDKSGVPGEWLRLTSESNSSRLEVTCSLEHWFEPTARPLPGAELEALLSAQPATLAQSYQCRFSLQAHRQCLDSALEQVKQTCSRSNLFVVFSAAGFYSSAKTCIRERVEAVKLWKEKARQCIHRIDQHLAQLPTSLPTSLSNSLPATLPAPRQSVAPVVSPPSHSTSNKARADTVSAECSPAEQEKEVVSGQPAYQSLGWLFYSFVDLYHSPEVFARVVSVRLGEQLSRCNPRFSCAPDSAMITHICVEEPFLATNVTHAVHNDYMFEFIRRTVADTRQDILARRFSMDRYL